MQATVIGGGKVGTAISLMYRPQAAPVVRRHQRVPDTLEAHQHAEGAPIWVCTTNDGLDSVLEATPPSRHPDLVFVQNGMLQPWLSQHGLQCNTQVLLYMAAHEDGSVTDGGLTLVSSGKWSRHVASTLRGGGVTCRVEDDWGAFQRAMAAKLLWSSIFWVMGAALGLSVGEIARDHAGEVEELVSELLPIVESYIQQQQQQQAHQQPLQTQQPHQDQHQLQPWQIVSDSRQQQPEQEQEQQQQQQVPPRQPQPQQPGQEQQQQQRRRAREVTEALLSYSVAISAARPSKEMALKEWRWRNGWFLGQRRTPMHADWLRRAGCGEELLAVLR